MNSQNRKTIEKIRSTFLAMGFVSMFLFGILYFLYILLPELGVTSSDVETIKEAIYFKALFGLIPYLLSLSIISFLVVIIIDQSISIYTYREQSNYVSLKDDSYDKKMHFCWRVIYIISVLFFILVSFYNVYVYYASLKANVSDYLETTGILMKAVFLTSLSIVVLSSIAYVVFKILKLYKIKQLINQNNKAYDKYNFLLNVTKNQYEDIVDILCEVGKEPKIKKSNYEGANRDSVSNFLIALNHRGKIETVTRANVNEIVEWLESINALDAHFSENIDDFLEKFSEPSELRLKRVSLLKDRLENLGI